VVVATKNKLASRRQHIARGIRPGHFYMPARAGDCTINT
jgi:hypothetical protein